jgi:hypothetical protein
MGDRLTAEHALADLVDLACVFHAKVDTDSTASWTPIPRQAGHRFHGKLDSDSTASWTPVPGQAGHLK